jgi:hypothetical protein
MQLNFLSVSPKQSVASRLPEFLMDGATRFAIGIEIRKAPRSGTTPGFYTIKLMS